MEEERKTEWKRYRVREGVRKERRKALVRKKGA